MNPAELHRRPPVPRAKGQLREGLRYVAGEPVLRSTLLLVAVIGTLAFNFRLFLPLMAKAFNGGAGAFGALSAMMGVGTIVGALAAAERARPTRRLLLGSGLAFGGLILLVAAMPSLPLAMAALVPMGAASVVFAATANTTLQLAASDSMRGRVMALYAVAFIGSAPVGGPLVGWIAQVFGVRASLGVAGAATILATLYVLRGRLISQTAGAAKVLRSAVGSAARLTTPAYSGGDEDAGGEAGGESAPHSPEIGPRLRPPSTGPGPGRREPRPRSAPDTKSSRR
jgi:MFS family permease